MKAKLNLSSIMGLVAQHVEKVVLAMACIVALVLVWGGIAKSGGLDWEPTKLATESSNAETHIDTREVDPTQIPQWETEARKLIKELGSVKRSISSTPYEHDRNWARGLFHESSKRGLPPLFALKELRASAGRGAVRMGSSAKGRPMAMEPAMSTGGGTQGQRWIVLTGIIPFATQQDAYKAAFEDSYEDPINDVPSYIYYRVERAEVDASGEADQLEWKLLSTRRALKVLDSWTSQQSEIVARPFLAGTPECPMAFPLAPVTNRQWGPEIAHEPEIPFYYDASQILEPEETPEVDPADDPDSDEPGMIRRRSRRGGLAGGMPGMEDMNAGMMEMTEPGGYGGVSPGMRFGAASVDVRLFRFFDFNVEPGKHYRYRVRLLLANPNQDVPPEYLAQADLRDAKYLETEFSDPTDAVGVPLDSRLLCVKVKSSLNAAIEPSTHMMSIRFDPETGEESAVEHEKLYRGTLANFFKIPLAAAPAARGFGDAEMMMPGMDMMEMMEAEPERNRKADKGRRKKRDKKADEDVELIDHVTEQIVLDMQGGQRLSRNLTRPCSILLLDSSGQLVVRSDLGDLDEYQVYHVPEEKPRKVDDEEMGGMEEMMMMMPPQ